MSTQYKFLKQCSSQQMEILPETAMPSSDNQYIKQYIKSLGGCIDNILLDKYSYKITDLVKKTILGNVFNDPVAKQYIPQIKELKILPEERIDPIGDDTYMPVNGVVHRYPDRVLLKLSNICAVYCRYCFRREMIGTGSGVLSVKDLTVAIDYIRNHPEIWEVILSGGDPLILSVRYLEDVFDQLSDIRHVQVLRIHTRVPIAAPEKITKELCDLFAQKKPLYIVLHVNHSQEITPDVEAAIEKLQAAGCILLSQSVLLKGVNDDSHVLETLFRRLVVLGVKPYYIHHLDLAPGTSHFRVSIKDGQAIMRRLLGRISGLCQPQYMLDIPGGAGKVPINPYYIEELEDESFVVESYNGDKYTYPSMKDML